MNYKLKEFVFNAIEAIGGLGAFALMIMGISRLVSGTGDWKDAVIYLCVGLGYLRLAIYKMNVEKAIDDKRKAVEWEAGREDRDKRFNDMMKRINENEEAE